MSTFKSVISINRPISEVYEYLADFNNHQNLMPDSIEEWASTVNEASFSIKNMAKLFLKIETRINNEEIIIIPTAKPPFDIKLKWLLSFDNNHTDVSFVIEVDLSMMMKILASAPLQKLADYETFSLNSILS